MRYSLAVEGEDFVPYPLPTLFVGVFVLWVGFGLNRYLTGSMFGYSGHGTVLILLGTITVFSSAGSVETTTQWTYGAGILVALLGRSVIATIYPGVGGNVLIQQLHASLQVAAIVVGVLAVANTIARFREQATQTRDGV